MNDITFLIHFLKDKKIIGNFYSMLGIKDKKTTEYLDLYNILNGMNPLSFINGAFVWDDYYYWYNIYMDYIIHIYLFHKDKTIKKYAYNILKSSNKYYITDEKVLNLYNNIVII